MAEAMLEGHYLSGVCRCGKQFMAYVELPSIVQVSDSDGRFHNLRPAEHVIIKCPNCDRLVNVGNGSQRGRRKTRRS